MSWRGGILIGVTATVVQAAAAAVLPDFQEQLALMSEDRAHAFWRQEDGQRRQGLSAAQLRYLQTVRCFSLPDTGSDASIRQATALVEEMRVSGDGPATARARQCLGMQYNEGGESKKAEESFIEALASAEASGEAPLIAEILAELGSVQSYMGNTADALAHLLRAQRMLAIQGRPRIECVNRMWLANVYRRMGDFAQAQRYYQEARKTLQELKEHEAEAEVVNLLGWVAIDQGQAEAAKHLFVQAASMRETVPAPASAPYLFRVQTDLALSRVEIAQRQFAAAIARLEAVLPLADAPAYVWTYEGLLANYGQALLRVGRPADALRALNKSMQVAESLGSPKSDVLGWQSETLAALGRFQEAYTVSQAQLRRWSEFVNRQNEMNSAKLRIEFDIERLDSAHRQLQQDAQLQASRASAEADLRQFQLAVMAGLMGVGLCVLWWQLRRMRGLRLMALTDVLTGLRNRRAIEIYAERQFSQHRRRSEGLCLLVFDIDHFKRVNDEHGHDVGDVILKLVAERVVTQIRGADRIGRIGGEEFLVVMPGTVPHQAQITAERIRRVVAGDFIRPHGPDHALCIPVTISVGVAGVDPSDEDWRSVFVRADKSLYRAKAGGRNQVQVEGLL